MNSCGGGKSQKAFKKYKNCLISLTHSFPRTLKLFCSMKWDLSKIERARERKTDYFYCEKKCNRQSKKNLSSYIIIIMFGGEQALLNLNTKNDKNHQFSSTQEINKMLKNFIKDVFRWPFYRKWQERVSKKCLLEIFFFSPQSTSNLSCLIRQHTKK